jgi:probable F420-dependent oxidoreductase
MDDMHVGVVFPQTEFPADAAAARDYAQTVEGLGYSHVLAYDHVLGVDPAGRGEWGSRYTYQDPFLEPFVLFAHMAAAAPRLGFCTGVLVLPQRQAAVVAKQAATLDVMCGGRLRLGVGNGWNWAEFEALGEDFHTRGRRIAEQIAVMRALWTEPLVTFRGRWHNLERAGINPLPIQRPIPVWLGGRVDAVLRRATQLADGFLPPWRTPDEGRADLATLDRHLAAAGRSRVGPGAGFGLEPRLPFAPASPERWDGLLQGWRALAATHVSVNTMGAGLAGPRAHLQALETFATEMGLGSPA